MRCTYSSIEAFRWSESGSTASDIFILEESSLLIVFGFGSAAFVSLEAVVFDAESICESKSNSGV